MSSLANAATGRLDRALAVPARVGGAALAASVRLVAGARSAQKPLHPRGEYARGTLTRFGAGASGVRWIDTHGSDDVVVRMSRAVGLPQDWPDVHGIALRLQLPDGDADLLFANTGLGRLSRFFLTAAFGPDQRPYTTLLPYRAPKGPVVLGIQPEGNGSYRLMRAYGIKPWDTFGRLVLDRPYDGPALAFDPMLAPVPGLTPYAWVRALRRPSYRAAQQGRTGLVGP